MQVNEAAAYLDSPEATRAYLETAFADGDAGEITDPLGVVACARGISQLAKETGLTRQALYKALSSDGNPEFAAILKVIRSLGLRQGCRSSACIRGSTLAYRSSGRRPVRLAMRASIRGPISSPSWKANTKSGQSVRASQSGPAFGVIRTAA
jgi:probable addiction module antidote protein